MRWRWDLLTEMKSYTTDEWYDVTGRGKAAVVVIADEVPELGEAVEINKELFVVQGIEKWGIHIASWKGKTVGLFVKATK